MQGRENPPVQARCVLAQTVGRHRRMVSGRSGHAWSKTRLTCVDLLVLEDVQCCKGEVVRSSVVGNCRWPSAVSGELKSYKPYCLQALSSPQDIDMGKNAGCLGRGALLISTDLSDPFN